MAIIVKDHAEDQRGGQLGSATGDAPFDAPGGISSEDKTQRPDAKTFSFTRRIIAAVVTCQVLLTLGLVIIAVLYAQAQFQNTFDSALDGNAMGTLALLRYSEVAPHPLQFDYSLLPPPADAEHPPLFEIRGADGRLIARSRGWDGVSQDEVISNQRYFNFTFAGAPYRAVVVRGVTVLDVEEDVTSEKVTVFYASSLTDNRLRLEKLAIYVGLTSLLLLLVANSFAIRSIRRGLYPLRDLAAQAGAISVRNWNFRPSSGANIATELSPLVQAIETVLARLKKSFRQQRDFTHDAAHELKTSVAIVKSTVQSLRHRPRTQREYEIGLDGLLEDCGRLEDLLERMLRLARVEQLSESGARPKLAVTELTSTCEAALERIRAMAEERNVSLEFETSGAISLLADPEDLELIWINLLENAVRYSPSGSAVKMRVLRADNSRARISVLDSGPGIPPVELPYIFERFRRGDPSRARSTGGFGLGLAICKALVDAYGGTVEAVNLPDHGAELRVHLPVQPN